MCVCVCVYWWVSSAWWKSTVTTRKIKCAKTVEHIYQKYALLLCLRSQKRKLLLAFLAVMLCVLNYVNASWREKLSHRIISSASLHTEIRETHGYYCGWVSRLRCCGMDTDVSGRTFFIFIEGVGGGGVKRWYLSAKLRELRTHETVIRGIVPFFLQRTLM